MIAYWYLYEFQKIYFVSKSRKSRRKSVPFNFDAYNRADPAGISPILRRFNLALEPSMRGQQSAFDFIVLSEHCALAFHVKHPAELRLHQPRISQKRTAKKMALLR
jgi:hypothetical protein